MMKKTNLEEALEKFVEEQFAEYPEPEDENLDDHVFSEEYEERMKEITLIAANRPIRRFDRFKRRIRRSYYANKAASIVLALLLGTISVVTVYATIYSIINIKFVDKGINMDILFKNTGEAADIPVILEECYIPSWIPEGYVLTKEVEETGIQILTYTKSDNDSIVYTQAVHREGGINVDSENLSVELIKINEYQAVLINYNDYYQLGWSNGIYRFSIKGSIKREELLQIAELLVIQ